ncbi:MAG: Ribonuclease 3 [Candidatus Amesbacteria bacterium GW2011_GWA2_42_12]|uniref:Ribonuclease 3 n=1 Tax=Candidatus Amesbacteria bacterium GW2011_GWA2_42_12 TaxID=1618356 RepID=A0A0G0Y722_9BACT|nr:MAG: Ribonuclease 3 [Candidatus Amesbacteria bacterium GW2011_GWA2_42_12]
MTSNQKQSFIHRSYCNEHPGEQSNERLEFLGDSVLSLVISHRLYQLLPNSPEGDLTSRRSHLVQTTTLSTKAILLGYDKKLKLSKGEEESGGRTNPGLMADTFEAVLGALFIDEGLEACRKFLTEVFPDTELTADIQTKDPKSLLQEKSQAAGMGTPTYETVEAVGPDHAKKFTIAVVLAGKRVVTGTGNSKQRAETDAAGNALSKLF